MKSIEIKNSPAINAEQERIVDLHSIFNILNVVVGELTLIGFLAAEIEARLEPCQLELVAIERGLRSESTQLPWLERLERLQPQIESAFAELQTARLAEADMASLAVSRANLASIFEVLMVRCNELREQPSSLQAWVEMPIDTLKQNFRQVFSAVEKNARGRYWFSYNLARKGPHDYYVSLDFESELGDWFFMPPRLQDVLRDLVLNARKYTKPGGRVSVAMYQDNQSLRAVVEDSGRGIPGDEIERVVEFGVRGSNVQDIRTMGGGFGLTKAVRFVKSLGGRFWIASEPGKGTRVRFSIPSAEDPRSAPGA